MTEVLEWRNADPRQALVRIIDGLAGGQVVVLPTDTSYIACAFALAPESVRRLAELTGAGAPLRVAVTGAGQALDWAPDMSPLAQRLARRLWPGPLTLAFAAASGGLLAQLPGEVAAHLRQDGKLHLDAPYHEAIFQALQYLPGPVVFRPLVRGDGTEITSTDELMASPPPGVDLLVADGNTYFGQPASLVEVNGDNWKLTRAGVVTEEDLRRLSCCQIVFVCTGNTCRSPLAEALCKKLLAEQLACTPEELPARGFVVQSAGLSAQPGIQASPEAVEIARELGADLSAHRSQPLTTELLLRADHVFAMTQSHLHVLAPHGMAMLGLPRLLSCEGEDVTDPIGAEQDVYRECARQILRHLQNRLPEFRPV